MAKHERAISQVIRDLQTQVRWKPGKDVQHFEKRKAMGHLPANATVEDYNQIIIKALNDREALVYRYPFGEAIYYGVSSKLAGISWLAIFSEDGIMETAFPPDDLADYLTKRGFVLLGSMEEVLS